MSDILVTGGAGYLGSVICEGLREAGHRVGVYDLEYGQDIHDPKTLGESMRGSDVVVHLAAIPWGKRGKVWADYWTTNVVSTQEVAEAAVAAGAGQMILASSSAYYGAHYGFPFDPADMDITSRNAVQRYYEVQLPVMNAKRSAQLFYAFSKVAAETILAAHAMGGRIKGTALRFFPASDEGIPYQPFGLAMTPQAAAAAVAEAIGQTDAFLVRNVGWVV